MIWSKKNVYNEKEELNTEDIYKELKLHCYQYNNLFQCMHNMSVSGSKAHMKWKKNYVALVDNLFQMKIFSLHTRDILVLIGIQELVIDTKAYQQYLRSLITNE